MHPATCTVCALLLGGAPAADEPAAPTSDEAVLRAFDIGFLTDAAPDFPAAEVSAGSLLLGDRWRDDGAPGAVCFDAGAEEAPAGVGIDPETLVEMIRRNIAEDTWADPSNTIEAGDRELVVRSSPAVLAEIETLLERLRARRATLFRIDVALVPASLLDPRVLEGDLVLGAADLDLLLEKAGPDGSRVVLTAFNEQTVSGSSGLLRSAMVDAELNGTGVVPVMNPGIERRRLGLTVEVEPTAIEGTGWLDLRISAGRLSPAGGADRQDVFFNEIESMLLREETVRATLLVEAGPTFVAGILQGDLEGGGRADLAVLVRVRRTDLRSEAAGPDRTEAFPLRVYDLYPLLRQDPDPAIADEALDPGLLVEWLRTAVDPDAWRDDRAGISVAQDRFLRVVARAATHDAVRRWLDSRVREAARRQIVDLEVLEGPAGQVLDLVAEAGGGRLLPEGWREAPAARGLVRTLRARLQGRLGTRVRASAFTARSFVADVELLSGGTGFSVVSVPDPAVASAGTGFEVEAAARPVLARDRFGLLARVDQASTRFGRSARFVAPADVGLELPTVAGAPAPAEGQQTVGPAWRRARAKVPIGIELPQQSAIRCEAWESVPAGRDVVLRVAEAEGGRLAAVLADVRVAPGPGERR